MKEAAILVGDELLRTSYGKTAHGLLRKSDRFEIVGVVQSGTPTGDAGELIGVGPLGIPLTGSVSQALAAARTRPAWAIVGIATPGGRMRPAVRSLILSAARDGLSIVNGLHDQFADDEEIAETVARNAGRIVDLRKVKKPSEMSYWTGKICGLPIPRVAVLGTDCMVGKRTTTTMIVDALRDRSIAAEMIYTGQTGWLQGADYGFILDATINDFVSGELESALLSCASDKNPDIMVIEGQSSMHYPGSPCGAEIVVSADVHGVVLQHAPGRSSFRGYDTLADKRPSLETEIKLISAYGIPLLGICLNFSEFGDAGRESYMAELRFRYNVAVANSLSDDLIFIVDVIEGLVARRAV
jgi:uncharacterized NAD-dependent epimerase/dehydratase family protein